MKQKLFSLLRFGKSESVDCWESQKTMLNGFNKHKNTLCSIRANRMCSM